eukprot:SAG11_NODE_753_length_7341_cov_4.014637_3_plen_349_part_00
MPSQLTSAFDQLGDVVASGEQYGSAADTKAETDAKIEAALTVEEDNPEKVVRNTVTEAKKVDANGAPDGATADDVPQSGTDKNSASSASIPDNKMPTGLSVSEMPIYREQVEFGRRQIVPVRFRNMTEDQIRCLRELGYERTDGRWDNEYLSDLTGSLTFEQLSETQKTAASSLGFKTSASWKYFMIDKEYSTVVQLRSERRQFLENKTSTYVLKRVLDLCSALEWPGKVQLTEDALLEAFVNVSLMLELYPVISCRKRVLNSIAPMQAWKSCEISAIKQALEQYSIQYSEVSDHGLVLLSVRFHFCAIDAQVFKKHVEAGLQGSDMSDHDFDELTREQQTAAKALGA